MPSHFSLIYPDRIRRKQVSCDLYHRHILWTVGCIYANIILVNALGGCALPVVAGASPIVYTEVLPRAVNGKGLVEDGVDRATDKDCRVIEGAVRKDRKFCETRGSLQTDKDFKGLSGVNQ